MWLWDSPLGKFDSTVHIVGCCAQAPDIGVVSQEPLFLVELMAPSAVTLSALCMEGPRQVFMEFM